MDIWQKGSTFPQPCLDELKVKLANAMASAGSSKSVDGADVKKEQKSSSLASGESKGSGKSFSQNFFFFHCFVRHQWRPCMCSSSGNGVWSSASVLEKKKEFSKPGKLGTQLLLRLLVNVSIIGICAAKRRQKPALFSVADRRLRWQMRRPVTDIYPILISSG